MRNLEYSTNATNVIPKFYYVDFTIYVEGNDDVAFWEEILNYFSKNKISVKAISAGGKTELQKYIDGIVSGDLKVAVACDSDYQMLQNNRINHPNVLYTYGYSIENSSCLPEVVVSAICHTGGISRTEVGKKDFEEWLLDFVKRLELLIIYDIAANTDGPKQEVMGSNCDRFMCSTKPYQVDDSKVKNYIQGLNKLPDDELNRIRQKINQFGSNTIFLVRGHFLQSAILRYVNNRIERHRSKKKMNNNSFFAYAISCFTQHMPNESEHYRHYENQITALVQANQGC